MIQRDDDEGVADFFVGNELRNFRHRHQPRHQILAVVPVHFVLQPAVLNQHGEGPVAQDGRIRPDASKHARVFAFVTGLLAQFAHGGCHRVGLAGVHHAAGNLQFHGVRAVPVLLDHHEHSVGREGDDVDPVNTVEDVIIVFLAGTRRNFHVGAQFEDAEVADGRRTDFFPRLGHGRETRVEGRALKVKVGSPRRCSVVKRWVTGVSGHG